LLLFAILEMLFTVRKVLRRLPWTTYSTAPSFPSRNPFAGYQKAFLSLTLSALSTINYDLTAGDGVYAIQEGDSIQLVDLTTNSTRTLVVNSEITDASL